MWLVISFGSSVVATILWFLFKGRYRLGLLTLMLWGGTVMILVDKVLGYEGGDFLEKTTDGLVRSGWILGILMLLPVLVIWLVVFLFDRKREKKPK